MEKKDKRATMRWLMQHLDEKAKRLDVCFEYSSHVS